VAQVSNVDLRESGYIFCMLFFLISELMTIHAVNQLNTTFASTVFYSSIINQVIYSQFYLIFIFYIYSHSYLASTSDIVAYFFIPFFILTTILFLFVGYYYATGSTSFRIIGGFSFVMIFIVIALEAVKKVAINIIGFVSSITIVALWVMIIFPYVVLIPFVSIFVDQTAFGTYVYACILTTVVLLVLMVGILTLVFNRLIDKYEEEKKYKYMMEDVVTLLEEEGVESQDEELHILYESYLYRDKKYVYFLKKGFPVNIMKDVDDEITKLVTA
jgi:hypothetical protein